MLADANAKDSALQVIVLGSSGGPIESNTTSFLVRSVSQDWRKGSVIGVDAGVHLSVIIRILRETLPSPLPSQPYTVTKGPFAGLSLPHKTPEANAAYITSSLVEAYLITHPHLDHIAGFVVNTAGPPGVRPKKLAGLPSTINAFKNHIFNNVIWPNLSDESNGAGLVTYLRLVEGGSPALGDGEGRGYSEICDGLLVKIWGVSHGHCIEKHSHRGSVSSASGHETTTFATPRRETRGSHSTQRRQSLLSHSSLSGGSPGVESEQYCVYDSSAYFIQDEARRREVLIFGDVEPDSISLSPRNLHIWQEAAPRIVSGSLAAVFIECSFDDSRSNDRLFGHLKPVFVMEELRVLAAEVAAARRTQHIQQEPNKKRKRIGHEGPVSRLVPRNASGGESTSPKSLRELAGDNGQQAVRSSSRKRRLVNGEQPELVHPLAAQENMMCPPYPVHESIRQLAGLKVVIIHVKEKMTDEPDVGETILEELLAHEKETQLGCEFHIATSGQSFYF
ncbi:cAMP phosphodiesterases class-II-domain-containing protein [Emericellopsis atlantica]|uniref:cAMP phosphodiesterases class-II-domain-containing protein n=1 Tax=Emericellopsis atlantica TaxID=2614577 RepID=A0A9P7ZRS5_9HYPO|nr:cAMP phosphodiesterases class-II-domain-containing protein [Emericellopsis atlantica]KAG9257119.1 cAMP phosphodiesterases class-II-domain-containing protein [Emericellopsis atlantica]